MHLFGMHTVCTLQMTYRACADTKSGNTMQLHLICFFSWCWPRSRHKSCGDLRDALGLSDDDAVELSTRRQLPRCRWPCRHDPVGRVAETLDGHGAGRQLQEQGSRAQTDEAESEKQSTGKEICRHAASSSMRAKSRLGHAATAGTSLDRTSRTLFCSDVSRTGRHC